MARLNATPFEVALEDRLISFYRDPNTQGYIFEKSYYTNGKEYVVKQFIEERHISEGYFTPKLIQDNLDYIWLNDENYEHPGITNRELEDPRIKEAWEHLQVLRRLCGTIKTGK